MVCYCEKQYDTMWLFFYVFVQLKVTLAPCIEGLILLDRLCYLKEQVRSFHHSFKKKLNIEESVQDVNVFVRITQLLWCGRIHVGSLFLKKKRKKGKRKVRNLEKKGKK